MTRVDRDFCGLSADSEPVWLTYAEAAKRVGRDRITIHRWRRAGMPMEWRLDSQGNQIERVVEETVLLAWWRDRMKASPVHFYRMRRKLIEAGETPPPIPDYPTPAQEAAGGDLTVSTSQAALDADPGSEARTATFAALLADLTGFPGQAEHAALIRAMEDETPACDGLEVFTHDRFADPEQTEMMRGICRHCPLLQLCEAFAAAGRPSAGMWSGMTPAEIRRIPDRFRPGLAPSAA